MWQRFLRDRKKRLCSVDRRWQFVEQANRYTGCVIDLRIHNFKLLVVEMIDVC